MDSGTGGGASRPDKKQAATKESGRKAPPTVDCSDAAWVAGLLQAGDSFYPTGSYAHSFGLEGLVQEGVIRDRETLRTFLRLTVLPALRQTELPLAAHAWTGFRSENWPAVGELCRLSAALRAPRELRAASENIGRQRAELAAALHGHPLAQEYQRQSAAGAWPYSAAVSAALEGCVLGAPQAAVLAGVYYSTVMAMISSAMKILRLGQNAAQTLLAELLAEVPHVVGAAMLVPVEEIGWFNPWLDIAAARHETADSRMFIS